ncbi:MAG: glycosyltransferase [Sulfitobacter sp.]|nr:glycosyltransferase [Sulfitobacter sp.]
MTAQRQITLLMGVLNGARYLPAQLQSIAEQTDRNWHLICSDDGSTDGSTDNVDAFAGRHPGQVTQIRGPGTGFAANYLHMIRSLPEAPGLIAFSDQDDIWMADKLARARAALDRFGDRPALYCARRWVWVPSLDRRRATTAPQAPLGFRNALIENIAFGHTIVLNPAAALVACRAAQQTGDIFAHDWWLYLLITGIGGKVLFDAGPPCLLYRQHGANALGAGQGMRAQFRRKKAVLGGALADRFTLNQAAMDGIRDMLTDEARTALDRFEVARASRTAPRLAALSTLGPYRQSRLATLGFWGAAGLGRI